MRYLVATALAVMLALPVAAQDSKKGWEAYQRGDNAPALRKWRALAVQGRPKAQFNLGLIYGNGQGVPRDYAEAARWYRKAAEQGHVWAQYKVGLMYNKGHGLPQDDAEAAKWYRMAAEQGHVHAQNNLGLLYLSGRKVAQDWVRGLMWVSIAAAGGDQQSVKNRDGLAEHFPPQLVADAYRLAREWLKKHSEAMERATHLCRQAVAEAERTHRLPARLLAAISIVESGRWSKARRKMTAWPWTVYAEDRGRYLKSKAAAIAEVKRLKARGVRNIDVGCMQINLQYHPGAFPSLADAFEPRRNVAYAAHFLADLKRETGSWNAAIGRYHSGTPERAAPYRRRVQAVWRGERPRPYRRHQTTSGGLYVRR